MDKFVYFDVGHVLIHDFTETNRWEKFQATLGVTECDRVQFDKTWLELSENGLTGFDVDALSSELKSMFNLELDAEISLVELLVQQFSPNVSIGSAISYVKSHANIGLLTNMYPKMLDIIFSKNIIPNQFYWDAIIDSSVVGVAKPDAGIYEAAELESAKGPESIIFIDNVQENLDEAFKRGWKTYHYNINTEQETGLLIDFLKSEI